MPQDNPIRIANISENSDADWVWIRDLMGRDFSVSGRPLEWTGFSAAPENVFSSGVGVRAAHKLRSVARAKAAARLAASFKAKPFDIVISHGPVLTSWVSLFLPRHRAGSKHLAFAFNFTDLPVGMRKSLMTKVFSFVDEFAVFTSAERSLYGRVFALDPDKIVRWSWGVSPPLDKTSKRSVEGAYFAAIGGEARDYETLCLAARLLPEVRFVAVARPHNFAEIEPPDNMQVHFNLSHEETWTIAQHAVASIVPLRSRDTPCGIVTIVGGMHLGKAHVATQAVGITDYITHEKSGLVVPPRDPAALASAIKRLRDEPKFTEEMGRAAARFAAEQCSEAATVAHFRERLNVWFC